MTKFYTPEEIADLLKLQRRTIYSYIKSGKLSAYKIGDRYFRITEESLLDFMNASTRAAQERKKGADDE